MQAVDHFATTCRENTNQSIKADYLTFWKTVVEAVHLQCVEGAQLQGDALVNELLQDGFELLQQVTLFILQGLVRGDIGVHAGGQGGLSGHKLDDLLSEILCLAAV